MPKISLFVFIKMINRVLIRIRIVQVLYSFYQNQDGNIKKAESELQHSFQKSYDLYFFLLLLPIEITKAYLHRVELAKSKLLPTEEDKNPNIKLLNNLFIKQLENNIDFTNYLKERPLSWHENDSFIKSLLNDILSSDIYKEYLKNKENNYEEDKDFWRKVFKSIITKREDIEQLLEDESLFWNDDIEIIESFVLKTIKKFDETSGVSFPLLSMFKDNEDHEFAFKLLRETMFNGKEYRDMIANYAKNWESERIAFMDQLIMQIAISEIVNFPSIPVNVTLNEYIDIAKVYSTEKSASFINGILDAIVETLRKEKKILK